MLVCFVSDVINKANAKTNARVQRILIILFLVMPKGKGLKNNMNNITSPPSEIEIAEMLEYLRGTEYHMILRRILYQRDVLQCACEKLKEYKEHHEFVSKQLEEIVGIKLVTLGDFVTHIEGLVNEVKELKK
jgi:hypothetical protein